MKITIIGWYGTETLGDRAILDGIFEVFKCVCPNSFFYLGSIYPFYTNRTFLEEKEAFASSLDSSKCKVFDLRNNVTAKSVIRECDLLIIGGGPLMDNIEELFLLEACFRYAKKHSKRTIIFGCGIGPLNNPDYKECVKRLLHYSDLVLLRDTASCNLAKMLSGESKAKCVGDPAIISIEKYKAKNRNTGKNGNTIAINFRDYPKKAYSASSPITDNDLIELISQCAKAFNEVLLVPMHTFVIGGDDRYYLARLVQYVSNENVRVVHKPQNLIELYNTFSEANACVGMRYHSIVMQTILNGNNYVLDYTDPEKGKISGFIESVSTDGFYSDRVVYLQRMRKWDPESIVDKLLQGDRFSIKDSHILTNYISEMEAYLMKR